MAEAFFQIALENLSSLIEQEIGLILGVHNEMKKLFSTFTAIQAVLEDAELKQPESREIRDWLRKLNDTAYEVDDILDECKTHVSKLKHKNRKFSPNIIKKILFGHNIGRRIKRVNAKLNAVAAERTKFHLREMLVGKPREAAITRETASILKEPDHVYGREKDAEKIVDILVNQVREKKEISVLPVIGVGGLGKTTLAQLVFNDPRVDEHFEKKLWVCVSDNFDVKTLVEGMIESATEGASASDLRHLRLDTLQRRLWELLHQKRYLLVLDDVWSDDQEKWYELRSTLRYGSTGTSIIVTTRLKKVAEIMGTLQAHNLTGLSEEHCWMLLKQRAFGEEKEVSPNLEAIGRQIVKKCAGVPLAAKALGGLLRFKRTEDEWIHVKESEIWNLSEESLILPALRLNYHHLPLELRQCFAYCAVFPKDTRIDKKELIFLWMAHGYISSSKEKVEMEDAGDEICNELVLRSLLQVSGPNTLHMHDLVHDLAQSIMDNKVPGTQVDGNVTSASNSKIRQVNLREESVAFPICTQQDMDMSSILVKYSRLRVLDASQRTIEDLPSTVGNLRHLRYLNLSQCGIRSLPNSLCSLWNLQTLNLNYCWSFVALPRNMRYLRNLRHLCLEKCIKLNEMPSKIGELTHLRTLSLFIVGLKSNRGNQLEELQCLNLSGRLEIRHLERVENHTDAKKANLARKKNLCQLILVWESKSQSAEDMDEKVLEALEPHPNLETLIIIGFRGRCFPVWMADSSLAEIVELRIKDCKDCWRLPQFEKLHHLKFLSLENLGLVEYVVEDEAIEGGNPVTIVLFPSLETLELCSLWNLKGLLKEQVTTDQAFPNLQTLKIEHCCSLLILPALSSHRELEARNCSSTTLASLSKSDTLTSLIVEIDDDENMKSYIPIETLENLANLKSLFIYGAQELISVPEQGLLRGLTSLTELCIDGNKTLTCFPHGWLPHLTALKGLRIGSCLEFVELPEEIKYLHNLKFVLLYNLPKMVSLPKALRHLSSSLGALCIHFLDQLESLPDWLDHLTSLESLHIVHCPKLVSLPACIRGLPNLQYLYIDGCPELARRCERATGEGWHKISHIPRVEIR